MRYRRRSRRPLRSGADRGLPCSTPAWRAIDGQPAAFRRPVRSRRSTWLRILHLEGLGPARRRTRDRLPALAPRTIWMMAPARRPLRESAPARAASGKRRDRSPPHPRRGSRPPARVTVRQAAVAQAPSRPIPLSTANRSYRPPARGPRRDSAPTRTGSRLPRLERVEERLRLSGFSPRSARERPAAHQERRERLWQASYPRVEV